jgi:uncharacterized protein YdaU (DUF1376 family)
MRLSPLGRYVYRELIDHCYVEGSIPKDPLILAKIADVPARDFAKVWPFVSKAFEECADGRLRNRKVSEVLAELERWHEQKRSAGRAGGIAASKRTLKHRSSGATAALGERSSGATAALKPSTSTSTSTSLPPTPTDELCEKFKNAYPASRRNKPGAVDRWYAAHVGQCTDPLKLHAEIIEGLERAKSSRLWREKNGQFIPGMLSFLEDRRWLESWESESGAVAETPVWRPGEDD